MDDLLSAITGDLDEDASRARENVRRRLIERMPPEKVSPSQAVDALMSEVEDTLMPAMAALMNDLLSVPSMAVVIGGGDTNRLVAFLQQLVAFLIDQRLGGSVTITQPEFDGYVTGLEARGSFHIHDDGPEDGDMVLRVHSRGADAPIH